MKIIPEKIRNKAFGIGVPPWVLIGSVAVLFPIFAFMTIENINRQREKSIQLLLEKGAALIRSFEAGTRTGMMNMHMGNFNLQRLLEKPETAMKFAIMDTLGLFDALWILLGMGLAYMTLALD